MSDYILNLYSFIALPLFLISIILLILFSIIKRMRKYLKEALLFFVFSILLLAGWVIIQIERVSNSFPPFREYEDYIQNPHFTNAGDKYLLEANCSSISRVDSPRNTYRLYFDTCERTEKQKRKYWNFIEGYRDGLIDPVNFPYEVLTLVDNKGKIITQWGGLLEYNSLISIEYFDEEAEKLIIKNGSVFLNDENVLIPELVDVSDNNRLDRNDLKISIFNIPSKKVTFTHIFPEQNYSKPTVNIEKVGAELQITTDKGEKVQLPNTYGSKSTKLNNLNSNE